MRSIFFLCLSLSLQVAVAQWNPVGPFGGLVRSAVTVNGNLLVGTNSGIYRSTDGGQTFSAWSQGLPAGNIIDLMQDGTKLYACIFERGVYRSDDDGVTWTRILTGRYLRQDGFGQSRIQKVGSYIMVRNYDDFNDSLFFTSDGGATWIRRAVKGSLFNNIYAFGDALFGYGNANIFGPQAGLYRSDDLGQTWVFSGTGMPAGQYVGQIINFGDTLYVLDKHIFRSVNDGASWTQVTTDTLLTVGGAYAYAPEWFIKVGRTIYSQNGGNFNVKVATWTPSQARWQDAYTGLPTQGNTLGFFAIGSKVFLARYEEIVYQTTGPGQPWTAASQDGINAIVHYDIFSNGPQLLATTGRTVRSGGDAAGAWSPVNPGNISDEQRLFSITRLGSNYLMGVENIFGVLDVYQATSPAGPWTDKDIYDIVPNATFLPKGDSMVIYGSLGGTPTCFIANTQGVKISDFSTGLFGFSFDDGLPSMITHKGDLYCVITGYTNNFSKIRKYNLPSGTFWEQVAEKIDNQFFGATAIGSWEQSLYLGMIGGGVKTSPDDGLTWTDVNAGLNGAVVRQFLAVDSFLLAATNRGLFRLKSGETTWADLSADLPVTELAKVVVSPRYVWVLPVEGGVWRTLREGTVGTDPRLDGPAITLYPNPAVETLALRTDVREVSDWEIVDVQGRRYLSGQVVPEGELFISVRDLPAGTYYCRVDTETGYTIVSFVKY
ncbi:MAG: T9SS type A sorting domain-containing protein [Bacteroidia bacterium]|nr:T9SS type A sorting domain-containing protein [Bacteroidia bacterium]